MRKQLHDNFRRHVLKVPIKAGARVGAVERMGIPFQKGIPQFKAALDKALADAGADVSRPAQ